MAKDSIAAPMSEFSAQQRGTMRVVPVKPHSRHSGADDQCLGVHQVGIDERNSPGTKPVDRNWTLSKPDMRASELGPRCDYSGPGLRSVKAGLSKMPKGTTKIALRAWRNYGDKIVGRALQKRVW